jgi:hypothetical protein
VKWIGQGLEGKRGMGEEGRAGRREGKGRVGRREGKGKGRRRRGNGMSRGMGQQKGNVRESRRERERRR